MRPLAGAVILALVAAGSSGDEPPPNEADASSRIASLQDWYGAVRSYRVRGNLKLYGAVEGDFGVAFARRAPDAARFEINVPLAGTVLVATASAGRLMVYDVVENSAVVGADDAGAVGLTLGFDLGDLGQTLDVIIGLPPHYVSSEKEGVAASVHCTENGSVTVTWSDARGNKLRAFTYAEGRPPVPIATRHFDGGDVVAEATYADAREVAGVAIPYSITVMTDDLTGVLLLTNVELGVELPTPAFETSPPAGVSLTDIGTFAPAADDGNP